MNQDETKKLIDELRTRQQVDMFDEIAFRKVTQGHPMPTVVAAIAQIRTRETYVNPSSLRDELERDASAEVWPAVADLISAGALRQRLNPDDFPSDRAYRAARSIVPTLMAGTPHSNAKAFAAAYKRTPTTPPDGVSELGQVGTAELPANVVPLDDMSRRRAIAAAKAAIPERDTPA